MSEPRDPTFLKAPPKPPPGPDPYRTATPPRRPAEPEPEAAPAVLVEQPVPREPPAFDAEEALFRAKLAAAHAANRREASSMALGALGIVVIGTVLVVWEYLTPRTTIMIRRAIPAVAVIIPCIVIAIGYLIHHFLRRAQGKTP